MTSKYSFVIVNLSVKVLWKLSGWRKFEDIMLRHAMTGSSYFPYVDESSDIADVYALRAKRIRQIYDYIQEMDGNYTVPWSEWISRSDS